MRETRANHTWDIIIDYQQCPACSYIQESRQPYLPSGDLWVKSLTCERCGDSFTVTKKRKKSFSFFAHPQSAEFDWS